MSKLSEQKARIMQILNVSAEEADKILADDKEVDRGTKMDWDLSPDEHRKAMKNTNADEHKKPTQPVKRERKANVVKGTIIAQIAQFLNENVQISAENVEITNAERQISFKCGDNLYDLTLIQKRKPKT